VFSLLSAKSPVELQDIIVSGWGGRGSGGVVDTHPRQPQATVGAIGLDLVENPST
jgi:hypothetical protein